MQRKIRVLVGKPGLDGHDRGAKVVAAALRDAGMEVIYTGLHQTPEQIVEAAVQEDVNVVALSVLSGAHMTLFPEIMRLMKDRGIGDRLLTGGGIIPNDDMGTLSQQGIGRLFGPGTNTQDIVGYIREWYANVHGADALPPLPPPPARPEPMVAPLDRPSPAPARKRSAVKVAPMKAGPGKAVASKPAPRAAAKPAKHKAAKKAAKPASKPAARKATKKAAPKAAKSPARKPAKASRPSARGAARKPAGKK
jgi:methylmalonyl-CoA mutase C-terminal domain/subunit